MSQKYVGHKDGIWDLDCQKSSTGATSIVGTASAGK